MDKDRKLAKEQVKQLTLGKKIAHYLYYYKLHIIVTVIALSLVGLYVYQRATAVDYDVSISLFTNEYITIEMEENAEKVMSDWISNEQNEAEAELNVAFLPLTEGIDPQKYAAAYTKLDGQLAAGTIQALILEDALYEKLMASEEYSSIMLKEYSMMLGENAKSALGINKGLTKDDTEFYYVTRKLYKNEEGNKDAKAKHQNAIKIYEKLKSLD